MSFDINVTQLHTQVVTEFFKIQAANASNYLFSNSLKFKQPRLNIFIWKYLIFKQVSLIIFIEKDLTFKQLNLKNFKFKIQNSNKKFQIFYFSTSQIWWFSFEIFKSLIFDSSKRFRWFSFIMSAKSDDFFLIYLTFRLQQTIIMILIWNDSKASETYNFQLKWFYILAAEYNNFYVAKVQ